MLSPRNPNQNTSSNEYMNLAINIANCAALPTMVAMRRKIGFRALSAPALICVAFVMYLGDGRVPGLLTVAAIAFLAMGFYQRHRHWKELLNGEFEWHTYSHGISWF